jgi:hypothetical protein
MNSATSKAVISLFGSPLFACGVSAGGCEVSAVCADSVCVVFLIGTSTHLWHRTRARRLVLGIVEPSRDGAAEGDRPNAIGLRGGLGKAGFRSQRSTRARIVAGPECDAWRM